MVFENVKRHCSNLWIRLTNTAYSKMNIILGAYIVLVVASILLALQQGDDIAFHLQRLDAIIQELQQSGLSALPIRIYHSTAYGYGYASPLFYGDVFMWPYAALAVLFNLSVVSAYKIMLVATFIITWLLAYYSFGLALDREQRDVAVFLYMISVTIWGDATNSCVGRDFATMFVPLCICSFFCILYRKNEADWKCGILLSLGMSGLLFSNVLDAAIVAFSLLVILIVSLRKCTLRKLFVIAAAAVLCIGISTWFICPMIEQMASQTFFVTSKEVNEGLNDLHYWTMPIVGIFFPAKVVWVLCKILGIETTIAWAYFYGMLFYVVLVFFLLYKRREVFCKKSESSTFYVAISALLLLFMLFQTKLFPHQLFSKIIGTMQFPWRVEIVMTCIGCLLTVRLLQTTRNTQIVSSLMTISVCLVLVSCMSSYGFAFARSVVKEIPYADYLYSSDSLGCGEYMPIEFIDGTDRYAWKEKLQTRGSVVSCDNQDIVFTFEKAFDHVSINYSHNEDTTSFELPLIYYKGYIAEETGTGKQLPVYKNENGLVCVKAEQESGTIAVTYAGTKVQTISEWISLSICIVLIGSVVFIRYKRKRVTP